MKLIGQVLLWLGFLSGSLATVLNPPSDGIEFAKGLEAEDAKGFQLPDLSAVELPEDGWGLIPWPWFAGSVAVCVVGIVLIRIGNQDGPVDIQDQGKASASIDQLKSALEQAAAATAGVRKSLAKLPPSRITAEIDDQIADHLRTFADGRDEITRHYGLEAFADVMTQFASGERAINRAWSASADGYFDEADECLERGEQMLQEALVHLNGFAKQGK